MKIAIELSDVEVKGLKAYLKDVADIKNPKKTDIQNELQSEISGILQAPHFAYSFYIRRCSENENENFWTRY